MVHRVQTVMWYRGVLIQRIVYNGGQESCKTVFVLANIYISLSITSTENKQWKLTFIIMFNQDVYL